MASNDVLSLENPPKCSAGQGDEHCDCWYDGDPCCKCGNDPEDDDDE